MIGNIIKKHMGKPDAADLIQQDLESIHMIFGVSSEIEQESGKLIVYSNQCPFYDGFLEAGIAPQIIHKMCLSQVNYAKARLKEILPEASQALTEFRISSDGCCKEEITLGF
jgi:hypothetical protein